jgi:hypothetical protein
LVTGGATPVVGPEVATVVGVVETVTLVVLASVALAWVGLAWVELAWVGLAWVGLAVSGGPLPAVVAVRFPEPLPQPLSPTPAATIAQTTVSRPMIRAPVAVIA